MADPIFQLPTSSNDSQYITANLCYLQRLFFICAYNGAVANIFELSSKDENITPEKAQMQFRDKTAYVWGLRYR